MQTSRIEPVRPSLAIIDALLELLQKDEIERLRRGAEAWEKDKSEDNSWWESYYERYEAYKKTGRLDDPTGLTRMSGGITSITRGTRTRTNNPDHFGMDDTTFRELEEPDIDECSIVLRGTPYSDIDEIEIDFRPWECVIRLHDENAFAQVTGPPFPIQGVEAVLQTVGQPWVPALNESLTPPSFRVFIGHGGDQTQWRRLKDSLHDYFHFEIESFENRPRTAAVISQILPEMAQSSSAAVLVLTRADQMKDGTWRGRQNVVHEIGYMQATLGWGRTIVVVEDGVDTFSNLDGTQHVPFPEGNIDAALGQVVAILNELKNRPVGICP